MSELKCEFVFVAVQFWIDIIPHSEAQSFHWSEKNTRLSGGAFNLRHTEVLLGCIQSQFGILGHLFIKTMVKEQF